MSIKQILAHAHNLLQSVPISSAHLDAELLLSHVLGKPREWLLAHPDTALTEAQDKTYTELVAQRTQDVPLAYLTHAKEFYGRSFYVDRNVLIPHPETEMIVDELLCHREERSDVAISSRNGAPTRLPRSEKNSELAMTVIDVGTGSGCIIITLAKELDTKKNIKLFATDISERALIVARKNAKAHGVDNTITFLHGNLLESFIETLRVARYALCDLVICANLPYLTAREIKTLPTIQYDPPLALDGGGADGLKLYGELAGQIKTLHAQHPDISITLIAEIGGTQGTAMKQIFSSLVIPAPYQVRGKFTGIPASPAGGQKKNNVTIKKDLAGLDRIVTVTF